MLPSPPCSPQIFYAFDELLLLKRGGETIFNGQLGQRAQRLVRYFEEVEGVSKGHARRLPAGEQCGSVCTGVPRFMGQVSDGDEVSVLEGKNAADWMLEVTSAMAASKLGVDFAQLYQESTLARCVAVGLCTMQRMSTPSPQ